jgi:hypothetical protein
LFELQRKVGSHEQGQFSSFMTWKVNQYHSFLVKFIWSKGTKPLPDIVRS